ncbi:hypothetical protein GCM10023170_074260 [Phytohabitans houttuyneae]|uniref:Uncharacterized protein n=1 Tax=Phytohabitans houttuyneae TaxID=1076126 RepID=A0A6V8KI09_9ACTN|nr:hypothetical protein Phou_058160 [Phytohabitans houttuyneae]
MDSGLHHREACLSRPAAATAYSGLAANGGADLPKQMYSTMSFDDRARTLDPFVKRAA